VNLQAKAPREIGKVLDATRTQMGQIRALQTRPGQELGRGCAKAS
jgi:hypothetical protein